MQIITNIIPKKQYDNTQKTPIIRALKRFIVSNIYKEGENRKQQMFFPPSIDEYVSQDNQVRVIDEYVELLDMVELGFTKSALNLADGLTHHIRVYHA